MITVSALGAIVALGTAIVLILKKVSPVYGMLIGAVIGGLIGGVDLSQTVALMIGGAQGIATAVLRIISAGILAGVLIESGAAHKIAEVIVNKFGENNALFALAISTMILTVAGVFIDVSVITVSPIALALGQRIGLSKVAILLAMVGGGKAGNIMSANPNAISASEAFDVPLTSLMIAGIIPAILGLIVTCLLAKKLINQGSVIEQTEVNTISNSTLPTFLPAISAPLIAIFLLMLRPIFDIKIDPLIALPLGGMIGAILMGKVQYLNQYALNGLAKMTPIAIMLLGTGALAGIITNSELKDLLNNGLTSLGLPSYILAPISGALMSLATASTTAGTAVASNVFGQTLLQLGVLALASAAMIQAGATVFDHMPHGSFFHATGGSVNLDIKERLKLIPYETAVGSILALISTLIFGVFKF